MLKLKHALLASLCLLALPVTETMAATAGVTAAVNQNAKSTPPHGAVRTVVLGANVVQDETIETDGGGLVQILLADGTTFTVGPNSAITIDRFVYDPDANTAQVSATIGRGVFRFIGGRTSKTEGGVQLNTPVGTVGIRGGMADLNFTGAGQIDLLFGEEVTLDGPNGGDRVFQAGYSIIIGANGAPTVIKTPPGSANFIQQALSGRPGSSGGSSQQPDDGKVADSGVPGSNSGTNPPPQQIPPPDLRAIDLATPKPNDNHQTAENVGNSNLTKRKGFSAGLFSGDLPAGYVAAPLYDFDGETELMFNSSGKVAGAKFVVGLDDAGEGSVTFQNGKGTVLTGAYPGAENFSTDIEDQDPYSTADVFTVVTRSTESLVNCDCMDWGYWSTNFEYPVEDELQDLQLKGAWVAGDIMSPSQYESYLDQYQGTATYSGQMRGYGQYGVSGEIANPVLEGSGTFQMSWNFLDDTGSFDIIEFATDDHSFSASTGIARGDMAGGFFSSTGAPTGVDHLGVSGAFVNDGNTPVAGVIGSFNVVDGVGSDIFTATGIFAGDQYNPH